MKSPFKTPEQMLAYRPLKQVLAGKPPGAYGIGPDDSVFSALQLMAAKGTGFVVVQENDRLVGVFSERDYARKVILQGLASRGTPVRIVMTRQVVTVHETTPAIDAAMLMIERKIGGLPVVDPSRKLLGIITETDLLKALVAMLGGGEQSVAAPKSQRRRTGAKKTPVDEQHVGKRSVATKPKTTPKMSKAKSDRKRSPIARKPAKSLRSR